MRRNHNHAGLAGYPAGLTAHVLAPMGTAGAEPNGLRPPYKDETHQLAGVVGFKDQGKADDKDGTATVVTDQAQALVTLTAHAARIGGQAQEHSSAGYRSPLLFDCCRCGIGRAMACLTCKRFERIARAAAQRRAEWGGA